MAGTGRPLRGAPPPQGGPPRGSVSSAGRCPGPTGRLGAPAGAGGEGACEAGGARPAGPVFPAPPSSLRRQRLQDTVALVAAGRALRPRPCHIGQVEDRTPLCRQGKQGWGGIRPGNRSSSRKRARKPPPLHLPPRAHGARTSRWGRGCDPPSVSTRDPERTRMGRVA